MRSQPGPKSARAHLPPLPNLARVYDRAALAFFKRAAVLNVSEAGAGSIPCAGDAVALKLFAWHAPEHLLPGARLPPRTRAARTRALTSPRVTR